MSRPRSSVPNQWAALGPALTSDDWAVGLWIGSTLASTAASTVMTIHAAHTQKNQPSFFRRRGTAVIDGTAAPPAASSATSSVKGDPWVDDGEKEVDEDVEDDYLDRDDEHDALDDEVVVLVDGDDELVA